MKHQRYSLKIVGASGQGINVIGEMLAKGVKREGYGVFAYREYPSLIKGGHATYQLDISNGSILSSSQTIDLLVVLNKQLTNWHTNELKQNSLIIHDIPNPRINQVEHNELLKNNSKLIYVPAFELSKDQGGNELTANIVLLGIIWKFLGLNKDSLIEIVNETFKNKPKLLEADLKCASIGYEYDYSKELTFDKRLIKDDEVSEEQKRGLHIAPDLNIKTLNFEPNNSFKSNYLLSGNELISLGALQGGAKIYYSYPMTPASSILTFLADHMEESGMLVKQVEDEITAAAMTIGSNHMGSRALTGTSGGGFDLMTEHISLAAILETPFVCILGQRPGPATGMPTWTTQGDLLLSIFSAHGEFTRCVIAPRDGEDSFFAIQHAMNIADKYQIPVIVLTDKLLAESIYSVGLLELEKISIDRGQLITNSEELARLASSDRYKFSESGVSLRWFPGDKAADFNANSDEHNEEGATTEEADLSAKMIEKRLQKSKSLLKELPEPVITNNNISSETKLKLITWGSTFGVVEDAMKVLSEKDIRVDHLNYQFIWPLKTEVLESFLDENTIIIEGNHNAQFAELIKMQTGKDIKNKILKWDGRPFFVDEIVSKLLKYIPSSKTIEEVQSAGGLVRRENGDFVIVNQYSNSFSYPKGHVEEGENTEETARREIFEETGLKDLKLIQYLGVINRPAGNNPFKIKHIHLYLFETVSEEINALETDIKPEWVSYEDLINKLTYPEDKEFILELKIKGII